MSISDISPLDASWLRHVRGRVLFMLGRVRRTDVPPSPPEARSADQALRRSLRSAVFGELGGVRPDPADRHRSWWGGCTLGAPGEKVPIGASGRSMVSLVQVRTDELGGPTAGLQEAALLVLWLDLEGNLFAAVEGDDFVVRTYPTIDGLVPLGPGYRESEALPTFPVRWRDPVPEAPSWEDFAFDVPSRVAWSDTSDWFHGNAVRKQTDALQQSCPIKVGGWPTWIQGTQWENTRDREDFVLQIDSTEKGRIGFGDSGSIYLFRDKRNGAWLLRCDFF